MKISDFLCEHPSSVYAYKSICANEKPSGEVKPESEISVACRFPISTTKMLELLAAPILFNFKGLGRAINVDSKSIMKDWAIGRQIILSHQIKIGT